MFIITSRTNGDRWNVQYAGDRYVATKIGTTAIRNGIAGPITALGASFAAGTADFKG